MIGTILIGDKPAVQMEDDGKYTPIDGRYGPVADYLNTTESPVVDHQPGDTGRPFGVAALFRAANVLKGASVVLAKPIQEPVPGVAY